MFNFNIPEVTYATKVDQVHFDSSDEVPVESGIDDKKHDLLYAIVPHVDVHDTGGVVNTAARAKPVRLTER